jgi:hypothetical protein
VTHYNNSFLYGTIIPRGENMTHHKLLSFAFFSLFFLFSSVSRSAVNPLGQSANYNIDKDPQRTSSMLKSGTVKLSVPKEGEEQNKGPAYQVNIDYQFKVALMGNYQGSKVTQLEKEFFTEEFLVNLREKKHYESPYFKADHLGYADAKNLDGKFYPHCDKILIYDMKQPGEFNFFTELLATMVNPEDPDRVDIQDLKALAHIYAGVPVLGAVKVDVSGNYNGMHVKAGGDYIATKNIVFLN